MARTGSGRLVFLIPISLAFYLVLFGFAGSATLAAQPSAPQVSIVPNASTLTTTAYSPDVITVVIGVNNTIVWTNNDNVVHTATGTNFTAFSTGDISSGATVSYTFNTAGTYPYHCIYHTGMVGTVVVKGSAVAAAGGGIPEFPYQIFAMTIFAALIVASYLLIRRRLITPGRGIQRALGLDEEGVMKLDRWGKEGMLVARAGSERRTWRELSGLKPTRTGKPEWPTPEEIKGIWE